MVEPLYMGVLSFPLGRGWPQAQPSVPELAAYALKLLAENARESTAVDAAEQKHASATLINGGIVRIDPATGRMRVDRDTEEEEQAGKKAREVLAEIASSRKRAQKTQAEINRLKKKTEAILDGLQ